MGLVWDIAWVGEGRLCVACMADCNHGHDRYLASQEQYKDAYEVMREMREWNPSVNVVYYVQIETVTAVHAALGIPLGSGRGGDGDDDHDGIEEDLDTMADETTA